jgi:hypothetical protein
MPALASATVAQALETESAAEKIKSEVTYDLDNMSIAQLTALRDAAETSLRSTVLNTTHTV